MRDLFLKNVPLKIFSLVLAALVWVVLDTNQRTGTPLLRNLLQNTVTRVFDVPIAVMAAPDGLQALQLNPDSVRVELTGDSKQLELLRVEDIEAYVRLLPGHPAQGEFALHVKAPAGIVVVSFSPKRVYVAPAEAAPKPAPAAANSNP